MIYIMPAGTIAAATYYVLRNDTDSAGRYGGKIIAFCDSVKGKKDGAEFCGLPVIIPEKADRNSTIVVASFRYASNIVHQMQELGFRNIVSAESFLTYENTSLILNQMREDAIEQRYNLLPIENQLKSYFLSSKGNSDSLTITKVEFVVTQRCTLKCRECAALMQYYTAPTNLDMDTVVKSVDRLFEFVDFISVVNIIGGEPLIVKNLPVLLQKLGEYRSRIGDLTIITNGTIVPNQDTISAMKQTECFLIISDYNELSGKKAEIIETLNLHGVGCVIKPSLYWTAMQNFTDEINSGNETFLGCDAYCSQVMNGNLYYCNFVAHGDALRGFPYDNENFVDLFSPDISKEVIRTYVNRKSALPACGYCSGRDITRSPIPVAIQIKNPIPYNKYPK